MKIGTKLIGRRTAADPNARAWMWVVRGITDLGVYITCPESRYPGQLLSPATIARDYVEVFS